MEHLEIERKFLVRSEAYKVQASTQTTMAQGFLNTHPERTVRVRIVGDKGFLTVKGASNASGVSRFEWEHQIPHGEAVNLIDLCEGSIVQKIRYRVNFQGHIFEVDEFLGENVGLTVAELELEHEDQRYGRPSWLGKEITGQTKYYNSQLALKPFSLWKKPC